MDIYKAVYNRLSSETDKPDEADLLFVWLSYLINH